MSSETTQESANQIVEWAKSLPLVAKMVRRKGDGWSPMVPVHADSVKADFYTAAQYIETASRNILALAALNMGDASTRKDEAGLEQPLRDLAANSVAASPAKDTPQPLPEHLASAYTESELTDEGHGRMAVGCDVSPREISVDRVKTILFPYLHDQITTEAAQRLISELKPHLRHTAPVSLEKCARAIHDSGYTSSFDDLPEFSKEEKRDHAKAVLDAVGVAYVD